MRTTCARYIHSWILEEIQKDPVDSYFHLNGVPPTDAVCIAGNDMCTTTVYTNVNFTAEDPLANAASSEERERCTRCSYTYEQSDVTSCEEVTCKSEKGASCIADANGTIPEYISVCTTLDRYDSFSSTALYSGGSHYSCLQSTAKKVYGVNYLSGARNVNRTELVLEDAAGVDTEDQMDMCEFVVDGIVCNSCRICGEKEPGVAAINCTNIAAAITTCDSFTDFLFGINPYGVSPMLLELEEGYENPYANTAAPFDQPYYGGTYSDGGSNPGGVIGIIVAVLLVIAGIYCGCKRVRGSEPASSATVAPVVDPVLDPENVSPDLMLSMEPEEWNARYNALKRFHKKHGHCSVPIESRQYGSLGRWVQNQQKLLDTGNLRGVYVFLLAQVGIVRSSQAVASVAIPITDPDVIPPEEATSPEVRSVKTETQNPDGSITVKEETINADGVSVISVTTKPAPSV